jgi:hypothetical protein
VLCALLASTVAACGRSGLRSIGQVAQAGSGGGGGHAGSTVDGGNPDGSHAGNTGTAGKPTDGGVDSTDGRVDGTTDVPGRVPVALAVAPTLLNLAVGSTGQFTAVARYSDGTSADVTTLASWGSDSMAATVQGPGGVRANIAGTANITARYGGFAAQARVVVMTTISLVSIALDPPIATLPVGGVVTVRVIGTFSDGSTADVTAMAKIGDDGSGAAVVAGGGRVVAQHTGATTVFATLGNLSSKMTVIVTPATVVGVTVVPPFGMAGVATSTFFFADATLSDGSQVDVTASAMWSVSDPTVASIGQGIATGKTAGKTLVTATFGGRTGQATLVVTGATLQTLQIDPVDPNVGVGVEVDFRATGLYTDGTRVDLTSQVMWTSSTSAVLPIDGGGHAFSRAPGTSVVTATTGALVASSTVTVTAASLKSIAIAPSSPVLSPGGTVAFTATGTFSDGSMVDITNSVTWTTDSPGIASVSNAAGTAGLATAFAPGIAVVTATSGLVSSAIKLVVSPATLLKIAITPPSTAVPIGGTAQLTAQGGFSDGTIRDITSQVAWASSDDSVATVANAPGPAGTVTGVKPGMVGVTATLDGLVGNATVGVTPATLQSIFVSPANATLTAGLRSSYTATGLYSDGTKLDVTTQVTWTTDNAMVATISNVAGASGQLLARATGTTNVIATLGMVTGQTSLTVTGAMVSSLVVAPIAASTALGTGVQYTATLILSNGTTRNVTGQATWTSSNPMAATIGRTGRATPVAVGMTTIDATFMGLDASTTLTVTDAVPTSIQITPIAPTMPVGTTTQFQVTAIMSDGTTRNVTQQATFVSDTPGVVGITTGARMARGRATAVAAGSAVITATYMGFQDSTTVTVTDSVIVSISVSPAGLTLPIGSRRQFTAQAIRSDGTSMTITGLATWTSDAPGVAAVSAAGPTRGQVTGLAGGTANISATYMGITGSVLVTVTPAMLTMVQVTPFTPTVPMNTQQQFVATAIYSDGTNVAVTGMATWFSSDMNVAQISNAAGSRGVATTLGKGTTKISATFNGVTGATTLTVTDATVTQIQVTPFAPSIPAGFDRQLSATAIYSDGTNRDVTALATWTSAEPMTASVSDTLATKGLVTGFAGGTATITAQYGGASGSTDVTVSSAALKTLAITPANATMMVGAALQLTATGTFDDGSSLDVTPFVTWTSTNLAVADVSNADGSRGEAKAFGPGSTMIQAQRGPVITSTTLTAQ